ncbi:hypothetical protein ACSU64_20995 [Bacillaceae bacterium C204]|uniref:hypothetical protein n=1 Tax=Neobacillus sp. 204 TaxID=3383351 RepID=UPI003978AC90
MNIMIEIHYDAGSKSLQCGSFQLKGRKREIVALQWWKQIKKEMSHHAQLEKVIINGTQNITDLVRELEDQEFKKAMVDDLPF